MRPIKLEITGLQSFSKKQIINFDELTSMGLFGIFGETGSGKSTILDAMIFSIFDQIPRTMGNSGKNIRSSLNGDSNVLEVYFKFSLGEDIFEITRVYKKKYNRKGEEKFEQSNPIMIKNKDVIADTVKNVEAKVKEYFGIGINDFTRSVVLPQGKFSEFLKLKGAEKMTMLENIFDLDKYGTKMSDKISSKLSVLKEKIASLENQIKGKGDFSPELMRTLEGELKLKTTEHDSLVIEKMKVESDFSEMNSIKSFSEKLDFYNSELFRLEKTKNEIDVYSEKIKKHELANSFKIIIDEIKILENSIEVIQNEILASETILAEYNSSLNSFKNEEIQKQENLDSLHSVLKSLIIDYNELENLRKCEGYLNTLELKKDLLNEAINNFEVENYDCKLLKDNLQMNINDLSVFKNELEDLGGIDCITTSNLENEISILKSSISVLQNKFSQKISYEKSLESYKLETVTLLKNLDDILQESAKLEVKNLGNKAFELSKTLIHGENCPVCGSKEHPKRAQNSEDVDFKLLDNLLKSEENIRKNLLELSIKTKHSNEKLLEFKDLESVEVLEKNLALKEKNLIFLKDAEKNFNLKVGEINTKIVTLESTISNINSNILQKEKLVELNMDKIETYKKEIEIESEKISLLNLENTSLDCVVKRKIHLDTLDKEYRKTMLSLNSFEIELRSVKDKILEFSTKVGEITLNLARKYENMKNSKNDFDTKTKSLKTNSVKTGFLSNLDILNSILEFKLLQNMKIAIENYENDFIKYTHFKNEILISLDGKVFEEKKWSSLNFELQNLKMKNEILVKEITETSSYLERIQKLAYEAQDLLVQIDSLVLKEDDLLLLQKKFKGRKFVSFLARKRLDYIAYEASKRLKKITRGRYLLQVNKDCDFNIVDVFNNNHIRDSATLSGGETFIVSLVLALALSSQLQLKGNIQLEFFFLDEGFGTLDSTLLDRVIEILEEIRWKEKMKIGIISHVEDLKIRIPRRLEVSPAIPGETGSIIKLI
ncbi:MAG: AAA family ATPase [Fusobacteriaceae bacterium]